LEVLTPAGFIRAFTKPFVNAKIKHHFFKTFVYILLTRRIICAALLGQTPETDPWNPWGSIEPRLTSSILLHKCTRSDIAGLIPSCK